MKYFEMVNAFKEEGIDIEKYTYSYGLKPTRPGEGYNFNVEKNIFEHILFGDRDNGKVDKVYQMEDEMIKDMLEDIIFNAKAYKEPYRKNYKMNTHINQQILDIAHKLRTKL